MAHFENKENLSGNKENLSGNKENLVPKRQRIKYKPDQVEVLERVFEENHYPDTFQQEQLSLDLRISLDRIAIWFQNRRSKFKRQRQADHMNWMRKQIFQSKDDVNNGNIFGTPKLPALSSACHVLSPIETRVPRDDSTTDIHSISSSPCVWNNTSRPFIHSHVNYHQDQGTPRRHDTNTSFESTFLSTREQLEQDYTDSPRALFPPTHVPLFDMFHLISPTITSLYVPSMHSVAQSHITRSRDDENQQIGRTLVNQQTPVTPELHKHFNYEQSSHFQIPSTAFEEQDKLKFNTSTRERSVLIDSDYSDSSPSKDKTLECLAQWC